MTPLALEPIAERLDRAARAARPTDQPSARGERLTLGQAYEVQRLGMCARAARGDGVAGVKLGFTSRAKALQMGVAEVIIGAVTHGMAVADDGVLDPDGLIHPRVEPEVAFRLSGDVDPLDPDGDPQLAVSHVAPALEVIDSRYRDFRFSLADVVADNTSAAGFVLGPWLPYPRPAGPDLGNLGVVLHVDGSIAQTGSTAAILGHPQRALGTAAQLAARYGHPLRAGSVLLAGAATPAVALVPGSHVEARITGLGSVAVHTKGSSGE